MKALIIHNKFSSSKQKRSPSQTGWECESHA